MDPTPAPIGPTLERLVEDAVFSDPDPRVRRLRAEWEETKRQEMEVYEWVCREQYETRLEYHRLCATPDPEVAARREADLVTPLFKEELDLRLAEQWVLVLRKVQAALEASHDADRDDRT